MAMKDIVLNSIVRKNSYFSYFFYNFYYSKEDTKIFNLSNQLSNIDCISDTSHLLAFKKKILEQKIIFYSKNLHSTQYRLYGLHQSIFKNINDHFLVNYPSIEHGLIFRNTNWTDTSLTSRASCLTYGAFRKKILKKYYRTPIFSVGPYIHYASDYYDEKQFLSVKSKLGKTLLVFPTHSTDDSSLVFSQNNFLTKILSLSKNFDSILICSFWWNIDDPIILKLKSIGCKIVSAGYREDPLFLSRLKTIIKLSDFCIGDSIGTHIGYCTYLDKPFSFFDSASSVTSSDITSNNLDHIKYHTNIIKNAFLDSEKINDDHIKILNHYWGFNEIKSEESISDIYNLNKLLTQKSLGFTDYFEVHARKLLNSKDLTENQHKLLYESLF